MSLKESFISELLQNATVVIKNNKYEHNSLYLTDTKTNVKINNNETQSDIDIYDNYDFCNQDNDSESFHNNSLNVFNSFYSLSEISETNETITNYPSTLCDTTLNESRINDFDDESDFSEENSEHHDFILINTCPSNNQDFGDGNEEENDYFDRSFESDFYLEKYED